MLGLVYMDDDFDWTIEEGDGRRLPPRRGKGLTSALHFWLTGLLVIVSLGGAWLWAEQRADRHLGESQQAIQTTLDSARDACRAGDGSRFFATQTRDPAWQATLLQPNLIATYCAGPTVTRIQPIGRDYSANLVWTEAGQTWQRLAFFAATPVGMIQIDDVDAYWGTPHRSDHTWGTLLISDVDAALEPAIGRFVDELVETTCAATDCLPERRPFTLEIRGDYLQTAVPNLLAIPSPRLLALDENGAPGAPFWAALERSVVAQLTPGTIRFAVPPLLQQVINFEREAALFMRENPDITVELVLLDALPEEPSSEMAAYDGAAYTPTASMVAAGLVRDITDFATSDSQFDNTDFYEQIWQSAWWRDRMWFVPQAGQMRLLFLDCTTCENGLMDPPSLRWTWSEMEADIASLMDFASPDTTALSTWTGEWAFLDTTRDTLLSYAYSRQTSCRGLVPARCDRPLGQAEIAAALSWYRQMTVETGAMPDVAAVTPAERSRIMVNWQSVGRRAALWVDDPVNFEHQLQFWRVGVVPFPGSDRFDGNTPFWAHGSFISQSSERPLDVWRWLVFLSERPVVGPLRYVPARPSVAEQTNYWGILPPPLREAMRAAFPFARPVTLDDRERFSRAQLEAVTSGALTSDQAAQMNVPVDWFGRSSGK